MSLHERDILVTSALPYANGPIHFGHLAGAYLPADVYVNAGHFDVCNIQAPATGLEAKFSLRFTVALALAAARPQQVTRVVAVADSNIVYLHDLETGLSARYQGYAGRVSAIAVPRPDFERVLVGDVNGAVRVWKVPPRDAPRRVRRHQHLRSGASGIAALCVRRPVHDVAACDCASHRGRLAAHAEAAGHAAARGRTGLRRWRVHRDRRRVLQWRAGRAKRNLE